MSDSLVPEDFDLEAAKRAKTTTPEETLPRCPECESVQVRTKGKRDNRDRQYDTDYCCQNCRSHFDEPLEGDRDA